MVLLLCKVVDVPLIYNRECERWHRDKGINVVIYDEMVCAGYYGGGKDSCQVRDSQNKAKISIVYIKNITKLLCMCYITIQWFLLHKL